MIQPAARMSQLGTETAFEVLEGWEDRYRFIIDIGGKLPPLPDEARTEENRVQGCQSRVWLIHECDSDGKFHFIGDSDSAIVKGLVAVLLSLFDAENRTACINEARRLGIL